MQFHLNGFQPGDPEIADPAARIQPSGATGGVPEEVDVLIVGCGPAGLTLAAQLAQFADIKTCIVEQKPGRLLVGQADGIACRTMEMFHAFGFSERVLKEACWVNETTFWKPDERVPEHIVRSGRVQDVEDGLSEFPHVILNQARIHDGFLDVMRKAPGRLEPHYSRRLLDLQVDPAAGPADHAVTARLERVDAENEGKVETISALCRRLRRRPQHGAQIDRSRVARRFRQSCLGRDGRAGGDRFSRHPLQGSDSVGEGR